MLFVDLFVLYTLMFRVMIPLIFTWDVLWIVDNRVNKANIFFWVLLVRVLPVRVLLVRVLPVRVLPVRVLLVRVLLVQSSPVQPSPVQSAKYSMPAGDRNPPITAHTLTLVSLSCFLRGQVRCSEYWKQNDVHVTVCLGLKFRTRPNSTPRGKGEKKV